MCALAFIARAVASSDVAVAQSVPPPPEAPAPVAPTLLPLPIEAAPRLAHDERYFAATGFRVEDDRVWSFFQANGGTNTFGLPSSRPMAFLGCPVQMFQRLIIQMCPGDQPALINLLDPDIFPYTRANGSVFPGPDETLKSQTPSITDPDYADKILEFVQRVAPDTWEGAPVNFGQTFQQGGGLPIWGAPISYPTYDPSNSDFIYQRFQRGIMHYRAGIGTGSLLLGDYLKAIILDRDVPDDLRADASGSQYFAQYCPGIERWICRPGELPATDLVFAFEPD